MIINTSLIPKRDYKQKIIFHNGSTEDIIKVVLESDSETGNDMCKFSKQFADGEEGLIRLFNFVRDRIVYKVDDFGKQDIKTPAALWAIGKGDCKSKTIFINSVLSCLKIPYIIRFTRYDNNGTDVKHVYTVANFNGKKIPLDTVYKIYGKEKKYSLKKDFEPMAKISKISGCDDAIPNVPNQKTGYANKLQDLIFTGSDLAQKKIIETKQKQQYVPQAQNIEFNKISEGVASLQIAKRELEIIGVMKPQLKTICAQGIDLINRAVEKDNYSLTGNIPKELNNLCAKINYAKMLVQPANSYGLKAKRINQLRTEINEDGNVIGAYPQRKCLNALWYTDITNDFNYAPPSNLNINTSTCYLNMGAVRDTIITNTSVYPNVTYGKYKDLTYLWYGRNTQYRESFAVGESSFFQKLISLASGANPVITNLQGFAGTFANQVKFDLTLEELAQNSSVLSNYLNDIYRTNPNGSMGSALFYDFRTGVQDNGQFINPNLFPASVIAKGVVQGSFIDSCTSFTGVSNGNIKGLARNGILFDNGGEQPEETLRTLVGLYNNDTSINGHSIGEPISAIIAAIAAAIVLIIGAIAAAVATSDKAKAEAQAIDQSAADTARLSNLGNTSTPNANDWTPLDQRRDNGENGSNNNMLLLGAAALGIYAMTQDKDKKKK